MTRFLICITAFALLQGCVGSPHSATPDIGSWDTCEFERMSMRLYGMYYDENCRLADAFAATLHRIKSEPEFLDRAIEYWDKLSAVKRLSPDEFPLENEWLEFKAMSETPGAEVYMYSATRKDLSEVGLLHTEDGLVVVKDGKVLVKHELWSGSELVHD